MPAMRVDARQRSLRYWERNAGRYDKQIGLMERLFFADTRDWICGQATGDVLEIAIGTGLNLDHYPPEITLTGVEQSPAMPNIARARAARHPLQVDLREGDAHHLDYLDGSFDTVVCTFSLCEIPDVDKAIAEMYRVLRPGGKLLLADHVASTSLPLRVFQRLLELITIPLGGEHFLRRPSERLPAAGFRIEQRQRFKAGIAERLTARKDR
jgi:ubiquinone/menaquinone biosynthesis C-methylase UbiE